MQQALDAAKEEKDAAIEARDKALSKFEKIKQSKEDLRKRLNEACANGGNLPAEKTNPAMVAQVKKVVKKEIWRICKMITNDRQLKTVTEKVIPYLKIPKYLHMEGESDDRKMQVDLDRASFIRTYAPVVRAALNEQRSYVQSEMKKIGLAYMKQHKKHLPPFDQFKAIALRNVEGEDGNPDAEKETIFDLYLLFVSATAGSATFGDKQRRTSPISGCLRQDGKVSVSPSTEAMCLVMFDNCRDKWVNMYDWKEIQGNAGDIPKYSTKRHEETKQWMAKYSDSCSGSSPYSGWSKDGIIAFNTLKREISDLRIEHVGDLLPIEEAAKDRFYAAYQAERKRKNAANGKTDDDEEGSDAESGNRRRKQNGADDGDEIEVELDED